MATQKWIMLKSHFKFVDKTFFTEFLRGTMARLANSFWLLVCSFMINLFGFIAKYISRYKPDDDSGKNDFCYSLIHSQKNGQIFSHGSEESKTDGFDDKDYSKFSFGFHFEESKYSSKSIGEIQSSVFVESASTATTSKYQYKSGKDVSGFMGEPETSSFTIQEICVNSDENLISLEEKVGQCCEVSNGFSTGNDQFVDIVMFAGKDQKGFCSEASCVEEEKAEDSLKSSTTDVALEKQEQGTVLGNQLFNNQEINSSETEVADEEKAEDFGKSSLNEEITEKQEQGLVAGDHLFSNQEMDSSEDEISDGYNFHCEAQFPLENEFLPSDSNPESHGSSDGFFISTRKVDSGHDEFVLDEHVIKYLESDIDTLTDEKNTEFIEKIQSVVGINTGDKSILDREAAIMKDRTEVSDDDYIELEPCLDNSSDLDSGKGPEPMDGAGNSEDRSWEMKSWDSDSDYEDEEDISWEHQTLVEQIKMEMRNSRTGGLPTILEESETPKMAEDLKPLKFDEKIVHEDRMEEIQMFYKSYAEKMRKLDVLNYQTMQAISFLRHKDTVQLTSGQKFSVSAIKSLIFQQLWPCKLRRIHADPILKSVNELNRDLELVYFGQVCLSWEILFWQHRKAKELLDHESQGRYAYNLAASEFQQFQVLVQRFVEDEPFHGPRVQNYAKNRCLLRGFLQVPIIKEDCLKDKKGRKNEEKYSISISMLVDIVGEAMQAFWEFLRVDKHEGNIIFKPPQWTQVDHQDHAKTELLMDVKANLQKKERRLKDILRGENCFVKKFQRHQRGRLDHELFICQVELRLLSRVLCLPRLTMDQLVWCQKKLSNINFANRRIYIEPSFLLFPC